MIDLQTTAIRRGFIVDSTEPPLESNDTLATAAFLEFANLGFHVELDELKTLDASNLSDALAAARVVVGDDRNTKPIYPGFPKQVQDLSTMTLLVEQLLHYWTSGAFLPDYPDEVRPGISLKDMTRSTKKLFVISSARVEAFIDSLLLDPIALSENDQELLSLSVKNADLSYAQIFALLSKAKNGENMHHFVQACKEHDPNFDRNTFLLSTMPSASNLDQLLRLVLDTSTFSVSGLSSKYDLAVAHLSDKNAFAVKMHSLSKPVRRELLKHLTNLSKGYDADALVTRRALWQKVMRMVHPYDFRNSKKTLRALDIIHDDLSHKTLNSMIEQALAQHDVKSVSKLLAEHQPGNLLRRIVSILRLASDDTEVEFLAQKIRQVGVRSKLTTLISAYNGLLSINDTHGKLTKVAGLNNMLREDQSRASVNTAWVEKIRESLEDAIRGALARMDAPKAPVGIKSDVPVPLMVRDSSFTDKVLDRGEVLSLAGKGDVVRLFGHWVNNQPMPGYMDIGATVLDNDFNHLAVCTWNSWDLAREFCVYSGDKQVSPGDSAAEYIDIDLTKLRMVHPEAKWIAMTLISWSGFAMSQVDVIAGAMLRDAPDSGEVFDPRSIVSAFKPTTNSLHSLPLAVNLDTHEMIWVDSSNGTTRHGASAASDPTTGSLLYDEIERPRLTFGEIAKMWADAHDVETTFENVNRAEILNLIKHAR